MIYLHTGQPGAGKTLFTLWHVRARAKREGRQVYYNGIPDLQIPEWQELDDPAKWYELPAGAIIIIDEAQREFRPRGSGKQVPESVAKFEVHRHSGHDVYLITQHPMLIDQNVRRLAGTHRHIVRAFGSKKATVHEWNEVRADCDRRRTDSSKTVFSYPKEVYTWYKSAELHTHKLALPKHVYYLAAIFLLMAYLGWYLYGRFAAPAQVEPESVTVTERPVQTAGAAAVPMPPSPPVQAAPVMTAQAWAASYTPRIAGLPHTAPRYDELTQPDRVPVPAACITMGDRCQCYTHQGTRLATPREMCEAIIARGGYYVDFDPNPPARERRDRRGSGARDAPAPSAS